MTNVQSRARRFSDTWRKKLNLELTLQILPFPFTSSRTFDAYWLGGCITALNVPNDLHMSRGGKTYETGDQVAVWHLKQFWNHFDFINTEGFQALYWHLYYCLLKFSFAIFEIKTMIQTFFLVLIFVHVKVIWPL